MTSFSVAQLRMDIGGAGNSGHPLALDIASCCLRLQFDSKPKIVVTTYLMYVE